MIENTYDKYTRVLRTHISEVQEFGREIGVPEDQLLSHDASKFSEEEFGPYARYFYGDSDNPTEMAYAWLHHIHNNPHHWQYWIFPGGQFEWSPEGADVEDGVMQMPERYILEMVADWHGAGKAYTGSWDIQDWLDKHLSQIRLHSASRARLVEILIGLGYKAA